MSFANPPLLIWILCFKLRDGSAPLGHSHRGRQEYFSALNLAKEMHAVSLKEEYQIWVGGLAEDETGGALSSRRSQGEASLWLSVSKDEAIWVFIGEGISPVVAGILGTFGGASIFLAASIEGMQMRESTRTAMALRIIFRRLTIFCM